MWQKTLVCLEIQFPCHIFDLGAGYRPITAEMMCAVGNKKGIISLPSVEKKPPPSWQLPVLVVEEGPGKKTGG